MNDLFRYTWYQEQFNAYKQVNGLFHYLRKLPFIGKKIPVTIFHSYGFKSTLFLLATILSIPYRFLTKFIWLAIWLAVALIAPNMWLGKENLFDVHEQVWEVGFLSWLLYTGGIRFSSGFSRAISISDREFLESFRLSRKLFIESRLWVEPILHTIAYIPALFLLCWLSKNWWFLPTGLLSLLSFHLSGEAISRWCFQKGWLCNTKNTIWWALLFLSWGGIVLVFFVRHFLTPAFFTGLFIGQISLIALSYAYLRRFNLVDELVLYQMEDSLKLDQQLAEIKANSEYTRQGIQMQKKLTLSTEKDLSHLTGMAYLNALLFQRYRSLLYKKIWIRLGGLAAGTVIGVIFIFLEKQFLPEKEMLRLLPVSFMVMYACSLGRTISQMAFVNCDITMLHYPFYREPKTIIEGFNYRLLQIIQYNSIFAICIFFICLGLGGFHYSWQTILLLLLLLTSLTALFSFHDLFIYYILQPFTKDMEIVNPLYKFLTHALYWVSYANFQLAGDIDGSYYILIISISLLLYVGAGYLLLLKKASKTFVLKH